MADEPISIPGGFSSFIGTTVTAQSPDPSPTETAAPEEDAPRRKYKEKGPQVAWRPPTHEDIHQTMRPDPVRTRIRHTGGKFDIPPELLARYLPGRSVEWKRHTVLGQTDPIYEIELKESGWWPVQSAQLPGLMPEGYRGPIIRESMMLYERPMELTLQARAEQHREAVDVIRTTERRLGLAGPGEMTRDHPDVRPRINQEYLPLAPKG